MGERLKGAHVLVVEDEPIFSWEVTGLLEAEGADVVGPASSIGEALAWLSESQPDVAVLDWRLLDGVAHLLAMELEQRGIPFAFHTAEEPVRCLWPHRPILAKGHPQLIVPCLIGVLAPRLHGHAPSSS